MYAASGLYRPWSWVKIGLLYVLSFCGVAVEVTAPGLGAAPFHVRLALMLGTALVVWVAFRAGARSSGRRGPSGVCAAAAWRRPGPPVRAARGARVAARLLAVPRRRYRAPPAGDVGGVGCRCCLSPRRGQRAAWRLSSVAGRRD